MSESKENVKSKLQKRIGIYMQNILTRKFNHDKVGSNLTENIITNLSLN